MTDKPSIIFTGLTLRRTMWGDDAGKVTGTIDFQSDAARVSLDLTPEQCQKIIHICADSLVNAAREVAKALTVKCIEGKASVSAIEDA